MSRSISRRTLLEGAALTIAAALPAAAQDTPEAQKITHADAQYQTQPKGQQRCEICLQFMPPGHCRIVQAPITPQSWCQFFAARENAH